MLISDAKSDVTNGYVDKIIINLATGLAIKANKFGDSYSGDIDMGSN